MLKNRIIFILLGVAILAIEASYYGGLPYNLFLFYVMAFIASALYFAATVIGINYSVHASKRDIRKGDNFSLDIELVNPFYLPMPFVTVCFTLPVPKAEQPVQRVSCTLLNNKKQTISKNVVCKRRGVYDCSVDYIELHDYFGVLSWRIYCNNRYKVTVSPRRLSVPINQKLIESISSSFTSNKRTIDNDDSSGFRDYLPGDKLKDIHWKIYAKSEELIVKRYERSGEKHLYIVADLNLSFCKDRELGEDIADTVVEAAIALCAGCLQSSTVANLLWFDERKNTIVKSVVNNEKDYIYMYNDFGFALSSQSPVTPDRIIKENLILDGNNEVFYVITANLSAELTDTLVALCRYTVPPEVIYIDVLSNYTTDTAINRLTDAGINVTRLKELDAAKLAV